MHKGEMGCVMTQIEHSSIENSTEEQAAVAAAASAADEAASAADEAATGTEAASAEAAEIEVPHEVQVGIAAGELVKKINADQACRPAVAAMLSACSANRQETVSLVQSVEAQLAPAGRMPIQPLSSIIEMLVRAGALEEVLEIDGVPYEGTLEDAFNDENISDESESLIYESITEVGRLVASQISPAARTSELFEVEAKFLGGFKVVLSECNCEQGKSTKELEEALDAKGFLYRNERTNIPSVYPSMYANMLKDADCIAWNHAWITTDAGRAALSQLSLTA